MHVVSLIIGTLTTILHWQLSRLQFEKTYCSVDTHEWPLRNPHCL